MVFRERCSLPLRYLRSPEPVVKREFLNRLIGLPLYYAGQFLLAFSIALV